jgi:hypothetical protein
MMYKCASTTKILFCFLFLFLSVSALAQQGHYPWDLTGFAGGATFCDEAGCFGPSGFAAGIEFGRHMTNRWAFELEGTYGRTSQILPQRFDIRTGQFFTPELVRQRIWGGFALLGSLLHLGQESDLFISLGAVLAYEHRKEIVPEGFFGPEKSLGLKGGVSGGAGFNFWFSDSWALRPEVKFYFCATPLSGVRYTAGLVHRF